MEATLNSKLIDAITYNKATGKLRVFLSNGQRRDYQSVPESVVTQLTQARSPGRFYASQIRGKYLPI
jgi:hypothetical protein